MGDVFISYSRLNKTFVLSFAEALKAAGCDLWVDWQAIPPTADWWAEICAGIEGANNTILVISPEYLASPVCHLELAHARESGKRLIPIVLTPATDSAMYAALEARVLDSNLLALFAERNLTEVARQNWLALARLNWIFFTDPATFAARIATVKDALFTDLDYVHTHTALFGDAREWEQKHKHASFLMRGAELTEAETWLAQAGTKDPPPTPLHIEFIARSRQAQSQRNRLLTTLASAAVIISTTLAILAGLFGIRSEQQRVIAADNAATAIVARATSDRSALESRALGLSASARQVTAEGQQDLGVALALEANTMLPKPLPQLERDLFEIGFAAGTRKLLSEQHKAINAIAISRDGRVAVSASSDGSIVVWETASWHVKWRLTQQLGRITRLALSRDGQRLLSGSTDFSIFLWTLSDGNVQQRFTKSTANITFVGFSPQEDYVISASTNGNLVKWNIETGDYFQVLYEEDSRTPINAAVFTADGQLAITGSEDGAISIWDVQGGKRIKRFTEGGNAKVLSVDVSNDPQAPLIASTSTDRTILIWDMEGHIVHRLQGHTDWVNAVHFSPDGNRLLSASSDATWRLWDIRLERELMRRQSSKLGLFSAAWLPDGHQIVTGQDDGVVRLWDIEPGLAEWRVYPHDPATVQLSVSADGTRALSGGDDGQVILWETATGRRLQTFGDGHNSPTALLISPDGKTVVTADYNELKIWDVSTNSPQPTFNETTPNVTQNITAMVMSPDSHTLYTARDDGKLTIWDLQTRVEVRTLALRNSPTPLILSLDSAGKTLLVAGADKSLALWALNDFKSLWSIDTAHSEPINAAALSSDGHYALSGGEDAKVKLWDALSGKPIQEFTDQTDAVTALTFSADQRFFASGSDDAALLLYDTQTKQLIRRYTGHTNAVTGVTLLPDNQQALTASADGSLMLWKLVPGPLTAWIQANRYVPGLSCETQQQFGIGRCSPTPTSEILTPLK